VTQEQQLFHLSSLHKAEVLAWRAFLLWVKAPEEIDWQVLAQGFLLLLATSSCPFSERKTGETAESEMLILFSNLV
jgi:hypothetical protein